MQVTSTHAEFATMILAADLFHVDTVFPRRLYITFFIEHGIARAGHRAKDRPLGVSIRPL